MQALEASRNEPDGYAPAVLRNDATPQTDGSATSFYATPQYNAMGQAVNAGRIVDPTLLAQQNILSQGSSRPSYSPLMTPDNYLNFYGNQQGVLGPNSGIFAPDYRAQQAAVNQAAAQYAAQAGTSGDSYNPFGTSTSTGGMGYGSSGLLGSDGTFGGGLGQGIGSMGSQDAAFSVLGATEGLLGYTPYGALANAGAGAYLDNQINAIDNSFNALSVPSSPGMVSVSDANGNTASFSTPGSIALSDANNFGGLQTSIGFGDSGSTSPGGGGIADTGTVDVGGVSVSNAASIAAQDAANFGPSVSDGGGSSSSDKIVCTAMNQSYGFGSFRNKIWLAYAAKNLTKAHEVGYHAIFLPLVDMAYKQDVKPLRAALENIARHRSADLRAEMRGTKRDTLGRVYRFVLEPLCYAVGKVKGY